MASDRATYANVLAELREARNRLDTALMWIDPLEGGAARCVRQALMRLYYCEGVILRLLAEPLPPVRDAVDEASAEVGETWD